MKNRIKKHDDGLEVNVEVLLVKEGDYWVALSPALRVTGYGKTQTEAKKSFSVEADIFFEETAKRGTLEKLLIEYGWTLSKDNFRPPAGIDNVNMTNLLQAQVQRPLFYKSKFSIPA